MNSKETFLVLMAFVSGFILLGCSEHTHDELIQATSPVAGKLLWGDTHLHTSYSPDAFAGGNQSLTPEQAFSVARGGQVEITEGLTAKLIRPLDYLVVADHAEFLGMLPALLEGTHEAIQTEEGRQWHERLKQGGEVARAAMMEVFLRAFNEGTKVEDFKEVQSSAWQHLIDYAEKANEPGVFTAFSGFEWSSNPDGDNLHRIVFFRDDKDKISQVTPYSAFDSDEPEDLWQYLRDYVDVTGGDVLAIPHNGNLSSGLMFGDKMSNGLPIDQHYAEERHHWEPVAEVSQIKGDGETHPLLSPNDEFADYGTWDRYNLNASKENTEDMLASEYARSALMQGLQIQERVGVNPYQFGMVASTDSHTSIPSAEEDNYWGKSHGHLPSEHRPSSPFFKGFGEAANLMNWEQIASGYAAVWATENTREAIFDAFRRREVYATTGTRISLRFFAGWQYTDEDLKAPLIIENAYAKGVPMGAEFNEGPLNSSPTFLLMADKDEIGANLDRVQVVKGWLDSEGETHEQVFDVVWAGDREFDTNGKLPAIGNTVDIEIATFENTIGAASLQTVWTDPDFYPEQRAFYYARVLEIPTPRWVLFDKIRFEASIPPEATLTHQERAYSSPIWYNPHH